MKRRLGFIAGVMLALLAARHAGASAGTNAASFLDIPVGAGPAAMGSAYSALATDAYAPTWNPAGLAQLDSYEASFQHLSYVESTHVEYASIGAPLPRARGCGEASSCPYSAVGASIQYFGSGDVAGIDHNGTPTGDFSSHYAAYNFSYGRTLGEQWSAGATAKILSAQLADVSAHAFAADFGGFYRPRDHLQLAATLTNIGTSMKFLNESDPLPFAFHLASAWQPLPPLNTAAELVVPRTGLVSMRLGLEWWAIPSLALRTGYRTDVLKGLSPLAGFSAGLGIDLWGQELAYAWVPYGDLGDSHYLSLVVRFGEAATRKRNLIHISSPNSSESYPPTATPSSPGGSDSDQLMQMLSH